jgi:hypothetical protein
MRVKQLLAGVAVLAFALGVAQANWMDDFEAYTLGSIDGQGGWGGWGGSASEAGTVVAAPAIGTRSQEIETNSTDPLDYTDSVHQYAGYEGGQWRYTAWTYIPTSSATGTTYFILMNEYSDPAGPYAWSAQLAMNLTTGLLNDDQAGGGQNIPLIKDQWVKLQLDIDLDNNTVETYYGATFVSTHQWYNPAGLNDHAAIEAVDLYSAFDMIVDPIYYDNMSLTPEPAAFALLALALVLRRR